MSMLREEKIERMQVNGAKRRGPRKRWENYVTSTYERKSLEVMHDKIDWTGRS